jgi:HlyD family secretion protein
MSANAEIILEEKSGVLLIPETAVIYDKDRKTFVEVPDSTKEKGKSRVPVQLGISNGLKTEVIAGLKEGQKIVLP